MCKDLKYEESEFMTRASGEKKFKGGRSVYCSSDNAGKMLREMFCLSVKARDQDQLQGCPLNQ